MPSGSTLLSRQVPGLHNDVTLQIDRWGVTHIRAVSRHDLFFAQGWNAARDRLWQIDIARKRGLGLLAADFGPGFLAQDRAARLFLYRGDMAREWAAYGRDAEEICTAFVEGINAYIDSCLAGDITLPPEFGLLGHLPSRWRAEDVVRIRSHGLTRNAASEILRARVIALAGVEKGTQLDGLRMHLPPGVVPQPVPGFQPACVTERVLRDFQLGTCFATFSRERLAATLEQAEQWTSVTPGGEVVRRSFDEGSNNWAIAAEKTTTGRPILALDPHRTHVLPSVRYVVHLTMPGLDVIGAGEPMVPGISMGHNGTAAFGLTIFGADQEDVYVYDMSAENPGHYRYDGGWEDMRSIEETVVVKGAPDQTINLYFTRHGPVLYHDAPARRSFALRSVWMDAGMAPYMASLAVMQARSQAEYFRALEGWGCPSVNHIYADTTNTIAWKPSGAAPVRRNWDGLLPVPGDGRYEWQGYLPPRNGPSEINPERGFIATANAMNVPPEWSAANPAFGYEWADSSRHDTLHRELARKEALSLQDCVRLQCSTFSPMAQRVLASLRTWATEWRAGLGEGGSYRGIEAALDLLEGWNADLARESAPAALFEVWFSKYLGPAIANLIGAPPEAMALLSPYDPPALAAWLEENAGRSAALDPIARSLVAAWDECVARLGTASDGWSWGNLHRLELCHPLQGLTEAHWSLPSLDLGGSGSTLNYAKYRIGDFSVFAGPSVRMVLDVGAWDNSLFVNMPGQSGDPESPHYADLLPFWHAGRHRPLLYSKEAVDAATVSWITLSAKI